MKYKAILLIASLSPCVPGWATTFTAATCNESDVQTAVTNAVNAAHDGDIVSIPAGTCTWTGSVGVSGNFTSTVTVQGQGAVSSTSGGSSTTGSDVTTIIDNLTGNPGDLVLTDGSTKTIRITGIALLQNGSSNPLALTGLITLASGTVRVDHCHFNTNGGATALRLNGLTIGVADHDYFQSPSGALTGTFAAHNGGGANGYGDNSWATADNWGTNGFFFVEDSRFFDGDIGDAHDGARYVLRYNTITGDAGTTSNLQMFTHGLTSDRGRATRAAEVYQNTWTVSTALGNPVYSLNSGSLLFWGNTVNGFKGAVQIQETRASNGTYTYAPPPTDWGYCGTAQTGTASPWDQNTDSTGYACMDQPTRGAGDLLNGLPFPNVLNTTTGTVTWPHQALDPAYIFNNNYINPYASTPMVVNNAAVTQDNRDYYQQFGTFGETGSNCTAASGCNITVGVNQTNRAPGGTDTCTAGPGGNTPGVGWWNTANNTLYVCNPTNTWSAYYTPFTYPHPLAAGVSFTGGISFGNVNVGSSSTLSTTLQNTTASSVSIGPFSATPGQFTISTGAGACPSPNGSLVAGATCTVYVQFLPTSAAGYSGTLTDAGSGATASLTGTGVSGTVPPTIAWNPTSVSFLNTNVGSTSYTGTTVLSNSGASGSTLNVALSRGGANPGDFTCTGGLPLCGCPSTITTGSCTVTLQFTPSASGIRMASLTETDATASNNPQSASLTGNSNCSNTTIGSFTLCGSNYVNSTNNTKATNTYNPAPGNAILAIADWCAPTGCGTQTDTTTATIGDNVNATEACFTVSPHSPYDFQNSAVPDHERLYAWWCPSIPTGVTTFTVTTTAIVPTHSFSVVEFMPQAFAPTSFWETVDRVASSGNVAGSTASVSTNGSTSNSNDLIVAQLVNCSGSVNMTPDASYTGIVVNPAVDPGRIIEARAVTATGSYTATATVNAYTSVCCNCNLGAASPNLTWFGIITPLKGVSVAGISAGVSASGVTLHGVVLQ